MRILVTGSTGFLGRHLVERLAEFGHEVTGASRRTGMDIRDGVAVSALVRQVRPEVIYHLAGPSFVPDSRSDPAGTIEAHVGGTLHLLEAARGLDPMPRVLIAGTADGYRADPARLPFDEETPIEPENPYAAAKLAQEALGRAWWATWGLPVVRVRLFNAVGPGQGERFAASSFARQAAAIRLGMREPIIEVGDLGVARDFIDWRDVLDGFQRAAGSGAPGEVYNIASGRPTTLKALLDMILRVSGIEARVEQPAALARPGQALVRFGSAERLRAATGWAPAYPLEESVRAVYEWWLGELKRDSGAVVTG